MKVYKLTNLVNGRVYVGQTRQELWKRRRSHIDRAKKLNEWKSPLHNDILEYGFRNFVIEQLEECKTQEEADEAEIRWIKQLNTSTPHGYNIQDGGTHAAMADSTKIKLRRPKTPEHRAKLSAARKGKPNPKARETVKYAQQARWTLASRLKQQGEGNPNVRLSAAQVQEIRRKYRAGHVSQYDLAKEYNVKQVTVSAIVRRRIWSNLPEEY